METLEESKAIEFFNFLYNETYLNPIIDFWINTTLGRFGNKLDFLTYWFDAWALLAPLDFALNLFQFDSICLFDVEHKKPNKKKKTVQQVKEFENKNVVLRDLQTTFCIPLSFLQQHQGMYKPFARAFVKLIEYRLFSQNKLEKKQLCFFKFQYNATCSKDKLILLILKRLRVKTQDYILFDEFVFNYRRKSLYFDGLLKKNKIV